jgi:hypothetical protein
MLPMKKRTLLKYFDGVLKRRRPLWMAVDQHLDHGAVQGGPRFRMDERADGALIGLDVAEEADEDALEFTDKLTNG